MKTYEICFSPTGGTKKTADILVKELGEEVQFVDLTDSKENFSEIVLDKDDVAVIAVPSFGGRVPGTAAERLGQIRGNGAKAVLVCVYGNRAYEDTLAEMEDAAKDAGFKIIAGISAVARHSIIPKYASGRPDAKDEKILAEFAKDILTKNQDKIAKIPGNRPYKKTSKIPLVPKPNEKCIKCSICAKVCPVEAIDPVNFKADPKKCISCMRCIDKCPENAREVNKILVKAAALAIKKPAQ